MAKVLELEFENEGKKSVRITIDNPDETKTPAQIAAVMDQILLANVFMSAGGNFVSKKGARIVERNVYPIQL